MQFTLAFDHDCGPLCKAEEQGKKRVYLQCEIEDGGTAYEFPDFRCLYTDNILKFRGRIVDESLPN